MNSNHKLKKSPESKDTFRTFFNNYTKNLYNNLKINIFSLFKWLILSIIVGVITGGIATVFAKLDNGANTLRDDNYWLLYFLPIVGLLIVALYRLVGLQKDSGTNQIISSIKYDINKNEQPSPSIPLRLAPVIFISTILTHLCGGSAGRKGAALQIGGSISYVLGNLLKLDESDRKVIIMSGMSACFAAVSGTPMAASIFALEVVCVGNMHYVALVPCIFAALIASTFARNLGITPEHFTITKLADFTFVNVGKVVIIGVICALISILFCFMLNVMPKLFSKYIKNPYIKIFIGGVIIVLINVALQTTTYMGAGIPAIEEALIGNSVPYAFIIKLLLTAITIGVGFKGGEIVPSFFIGATLGCTLGHILGISPSLCAALGLIGLFCGVTNCPITSILIAFEMFGYKNVPFFLIIVSISYMMSGYNSLYNEQTILYGKLKDTSLKK